MSFVFGVHFCHCLFFFFFCQHKNPNQTRVDGPAHFELSGEGKVLVVSRKCVHFLLNIPFCCAFVHRSTVPNSSPTTGFGPNMFTSLILLHLILVLGKVKGVYEVLSGSHCSNKDFDSFVLVPFGKEKRESTATNPATKTVPCYLRIWSWSFFSTFGFYFRPLALFLCKDEMCDACTFLHSFDTTGSFLDMLFGFSADHQPKPTFMHIWIHVLKNMSHCCFFKGYVFVQSVLNAFWTAFNHSGSL